MNICTSFRRHDVTIVSPHNTMHISLAFTQAGGAATRAEALNISKYAHLCHIHHTELEPVGFDVHGGAGESAKSLLRRNAEFFGQKRGTKPIIEYHYLAMCLERTELQLTAAAVNRCRLTYASGLKGGL
ncbi:hypothetical protein BWQ96_04310 [Gracilariopsis chorda]|uniref:Uncharacterized protein n=1 Tax=Gracilariopsis chorda TaxID=448386 RepID=A0A2V3IUU1_9FLOR|nr:hypothetical protein BWQ96_04310 [Gracilariopsis chorda]|eukprot:PXF45875.1 hypothetical protein BWQ96_04310 [Gracilariopsis chorda]